MSIALIIELFRQIALNHLMIKSFEVCRPFDYNVSDQHLYPLIYLESDFNMEFPQTEIATYSIAFFVLSRWLDASSAIETQQLVLSDMEMIAKTVMLKLRQYKYLTFEDFTFLAVQDIFGDRTIGWRVECKAIGAIGVCKEGFDPLFNINDIKVCP